MYIKVTHVNPCFFQASTLLFESTTNRVLSSHLQSFMSTVPTSTSFTIIPLEITIISYVLSVEQLEFSLSDRGWVTGNASPIYCLNLAPSQFKKAATGLFLSLRRCPYGLSALMCMYFAVVVGQGEDWSLSSNYAVQRFRDWSEGSWIKKKGRKAVKNVHVFLDLSRTKPS